MFSPIVLALLAAVASARGGVLYHRQHADQLPQQNYLDDGVHLVKITRTLAVPVHLQVPLAHHEVPLVLASAPQLVSVVPRLTLIPQHYVQQEASQQSPKQEVKPAFSRQQHEQFHFNGQQN